MNEEWYELRVAGSAGTTLGIEAGMRDGKVVGDSGHLVGIGSGHVLRFATIKDARNYLLDSSIGYIYQFEVVRCTEHTAEPVRVGSPSGS
jgi:hypothetical protein